MLFGAGGSFFRHLYALKAEEIVNSIHFELFNIQKFVFG